MDAAQVAAYFRGKNILITGATGFLGKVLLEKILRIQPDVTRLFLLVRATDDESARQRVQTEVTGREIFQVLREKHGKGFEDFIEEKVCPLAGDVMYEDFGLDTAKLKEVSKVVDIIVNGAATTNFYERYDVSFDTNVLGAKQICALANKCTKLKMLLHVSTAYVCGEQEGLILEKPFMMGDTLREGTHLDIESELNLIKHTQMELKANCATDKAERKTMKELGLKRARHFGWPNTYVFTKAMGEMLLGHLRGDLPVVVIRPSIITSILKEPLPGWMEGVRTIDSVFLGYAKQALKFFLVDPNTIMDVILHLVNVGLCGVFSGRYNELSGKYRLAMHLIELYAPYTLFKGRFDDMNLEKLRKAMEQNSDGGEYYFDFDPKKINWDDYFYMVHFPGYRPNAALKEMYMISRFVTQHQGTLRQKKSSGTFLKVATKHPRKPCLESTSSVS
ncbi:unnamed protein product [Triticum turgidum subsp. durum]|uniref:Fatty acyl-CoA reductase n=1 Tax=Triticum turgidum subsp. durum TaxID=4567 RepID=A0A9R1BII5_TRITD|nr:unnamed protein product [Triticum turgidum subsp. durum]